ncbi:uncharacterized protein LOC133192744 [Saccostrea echinata]|uniref:uncharacterized protein LOC133192744 n=1 Tax=Saccostrea echinata TaxID=191078 RepID=UPI002A81E505|nr:uncharacterized protein LOC133192744 [Saccostrea echinata]
MALFMQLQKVSSQLFNRCAPQKLCVRYKYVNRTALKRNRRKKNDMSWAADLLNYQKNVLKEQPEPSPLHLVKRIKPLHVFGRPKKEKTMLEKIGFTSKLGSKNAPNAVIVKNTPTINNQLMLIKHLVTVTPITFPYGYPESEADFEHCRLNDNGEFIFVKDITPKEEQQMLPMEPKTETVWDMDSETIKKHTEKIRRDMSLNEEFFTVDPVYKLNQDGKEYRYFGDKSNEGIKHHNELIDHKDGSKKMS